MLPIPSTKSEKLYILRPGHTLFCLPRLAATRLLPAIASLFACVAFFSFPVLSQMQTSARKGSIERIKVHGTGLENNLSGDSPDRDVSVYLPAGYKADSGRRYPVIYMLHGFTDSDAKWFGLEKHWINLPSLIDKASEQAGNREFIVVMPDAFTRFQGSMYSNSVTTGNWEDFVAKELVTYIDSHYRTIPQASSRGLAGHSMGGYGTIRIGMKHPEIFSSLYALSPCCMMPDLTLEKSTDRLSKLAAIKSMTDFTQADFFTKAMFASGAAWSPNPKNPPFFLDFPVEGGHYQPMVVARWTANMPLAMVDQYVTNLKRLHAVAFDAGGSDEPIATTVRLFDGVLKKYDIPHTFEIYDGNHISRIGERIETKMLPFFSANLAFDDAAR
jgi:S-formylglutathione hydrolase